MNLGAALSDLVTGKASTGDLVGSIVVETRFTPPIVIDKPLAGGGAPNPIAALLMPKITVTTPYGQVVKAPYGEPKDNYWPLVATGGVVLLAGLLLLAVRGLRK